MLFWATGESLWLQKHFKMNDTLLWKFISWPFLWSLRVMVTVLLEILDNSAIPMYWVYSLYDIWTCKTETRTNIFRQSTPFSFLKITPCTDFKNVLCQWFQARFSCEKNTCCRSNYSLLTIVLFPSTWFETNVIRLHISITSHVSWFVPVQSQSRRISVQGWPQVLNLSWNQSYVINVHKIVWSSSDKCERHFCA